MSKESRAAPSLGSGVLCFNTTQRINSHVPPKSSVYETRLGLVWEVWKAPSPRREFFCFFSLPIRQGEGSTSHRPEFPECPWKGSREKAVGGVDPISHAKKENKQEKKRPESPHRALASKSWARPGRLPNDPPPKKNEEASPYEQLNCSRAFNHRL